MLRTSFRVIAVVALCFAAGAGCSDSTDPLLSTGSDVDPERRDRGGNDTGDAGDASDALDAGGADAGGADAGDTGGTSDTTAVDGGGSSPGTCAENVVFNGQVFTPDDPDPTSPNGGVPRYEPYEAAYDANLQAVLDAVPAADGETADVDIVITGATVVATSFNNDSAQRAQSQFWLADASGTIAVYFSAEEVASEPSFAIKVGQRISGTVTSVGNFRGMSQIQRATDWTLDSEDNPVYIREINGIDLTVADSNTIVRATGLITGIQNPECGGRSTCFELDHDAPGGPTVFRTSSDYVEVGTCLTYVGPVRLFGNAPQLDTINFAWIWTYEE